MLQSLKKWAVVVPVLTAIVAALCFLFGQAYQRGCEKTQIEQTHDATVELFVARKEMTSAINDLDKRVETLSVKIDNVERSNGRIERTLERIVVPVVTGKKVSSVENYDWRRRP